MHPPENTSLADGSFLVLPLRPGSSFSWEGDGGEEGQEGDEMEKEDKAPEWKWRVVGGIGKKRSKQDWRIEK